MVARALAFPVPKLVDIRYTDDCERVDFSFRGDEERDHVRPGLGILLGQQPLHEDAHHDG